MLLLRATGFKSIQFYPLSYGKLLSFLTKKGGRMCNAWRWHRKTKVSVTVGVLFAIYYNCLLRWPWNFSRTRTASISLPLCLQHLVEADPLIHMCWTEIPRLKYLKCIYTLFSLILCLQINLKRKRYITTLIPDRVHNSTGLNSKINIKGFKIGSISLKFL